jgi:hypothetical protein
MTPEIAKLLSYQKNAILVNSIVSVVASVAIAAVVFNDTVVAIIGAAVLTWAANVFLNNTTAFIFQWMIYRGDIDALERDLQEAQEELQSQLDGTADTQIAKLPIEQADEEDTANHTFMLNILDQPATPIARYMDEDIYEWIEIETSSGPPQRFIFEGTRPYQEGEPIEVPDNCILIPPGILYRLDDACTAGSLKAIVVKE